MKGSRVIRALVGLAVLFTLIIVVRGWWSDYRDANRDASRTRRTESSVEPTPTASEEDGAGEDGGATEESEAPAQKGETVVVLIDGLNFRSEPKSSARSLRGLDKGEKLELLGERDGWYEVKDGEGNTGWVSTNPTYTRTERR